MSNYKDKTVLVYDNGLFVELAITLSKSFGRTLYHTPWESAFPKSNHLLIGKGIPGVERVDDFWKVVPEVDLFVFPDVYSGSLQKRLQEMGKRVWGSRLGEELELDRVASKKHLKSLHIPIGKYTVVKGLPALREHLKENNDQRVKVSFTRGDMESFHAKNYNLIEPRLDELEHSLGAKKTYMEFICENDIPDAVEIGYDGYTVDGEFPKSAMVGIELKGKGYCGVFQTTKQMPFQISGLNKAVSGMLKNYEYRNFFSMEARITRDGTPWVIDPCCRMGSPPGELCMAMYTNLDDIMWHGGEGKLVDPIPAGKWGVELLIHSSWADKNWQPISFPKEMREWIKFRNMCIIDGKYYVIPQNTGLEGVGAVVAVGDTLQKAIDLCKERAKKVQGYFLDIFPESLDQTTKEIEKLKEFGIEL